MNKTKDLVCIVLVAASIIALGGCGNSANDIAETEARGNEVIHALSKYKSDHSSYPTDLTDLVPTYLTLIRKPTLGAEEWEYTPSKDGRVFVLSTVDSSKWDANCFYTSDTGHWYVDTN